MTQRYDTCEGMLTYLDSLEGLHRLIDERRAARRREEPLREWLVCNRLRLDGYGQVMQCETVVSGPLVFLVSEIHGRWSCSTNVSIPPARGECPHCNQGWTIDNWFDSIAVRSNETIDGAPYVGKRIGDINEILNAEGKRQHWVHEQYLLNARDIDMSPEDPDKDHNWPKNPHGTRKTTADTLIEEGDQLSVDVWTYFHLDCRTEYRKVEETRYFEEIFTAAGFPEFKLTPIPNQYWREQTAAPWFRVDTGIGQFVIGWRKRVINIDAPDHIHTDALFPEERVTKDGSKIHAWSKDKAIEYLQRMRQ